MQISELMPLMFDTKKRKKRERHPNYSGGRGSQVMITCDGRTLSARDWAKERNMSVDTIMSRKLLGWSDEKTIKTPIDKSKRTKKNHAKGFYKNG